MHTKCYALIIVICVLDSKNEKKNNRNCLGVFCLPRSNWKWTKGSHFMEKATQHLMYLRNFINSTHFQ